MNHTLLKHLNCEFPYCNICEGGLALCTVCGGAEVTLPTDCPGVRLSPGQHDAIQNGELNYVGGQWVEYPTPKQQILTALRRLDGKADTSELAQVTDLPLGDLVVALQELLSEGLVVRDAKLYTLPRPIASIDQVLQQRLARA